LKKRIFQPSLVRWGIGPVDPGDSGERRSVVALILMRRKRSASLSRTRGSVVDSLRAGTPLARTLVAGGRPGLAMTRRLFRNLWRTFKINNDGETFTSKLEDTAFDVIAVC
jgi:hypothetical protein